MCASACLPAAARVAAYPGGIVAALQKTMHRCRAECGLYDSQSEPLMFDQQLFKPGTPSDSMASMRPSAVTPSHTIGDAVIWLLSSGLSLASPNDAPDVVPHDCRVADIILQQEVHFIAHAVMQVT